MMLAQRCWFSPRSSCPSSICSAWKRLLVSSTPPVCQQRWLPAKGSSSSPYLVNLCRLLAATPTLCRLPWVIGLQAGPGWCSFPRHWNVIVGIQGRSITLGPYQQGGTLHKRSSLGGRRRQRGPWPQRGIWLLEQWLWPGLGSSSSDDSDCHFSICISNSESQALKKRY